MSESYVTYNPNLVPYSRAVSGSFLINMHAHIHILLLLLFLSVVSALPSWLLIGQQHLRLLAPSSSSPYGKMKMIPPPDPNVNWTEQGWADPRLNGGRMLDFTTAHYGEPLNVIISALSDPYILTEEGMRVYAKCVFSQWPYSSSR